MTRWMCGTNSRVFPSSRFGCEWPAPLYRTRKIAAVEQITGRPLIVYGSACTSPGKNVPGQMLMLDFSDKIGFKTITKKIDPPNLDVLVHSPGGLPEATESLVQQLRNKYTSIRFIVPSFAKSAATSLPATRLQSARKSTRSTWSFWARMVMVQLQKHFVGTTADKVLTKVSRPILTVKI